MVEMGCSRTGYYPEAKKIISGRWVIPGPVAPVPKFMLTVALKKKEKKTDAVEPGEQAIIHR